MTRADKAYGTITATNVGSRVCSITGYPGIVALDQNRLPAMTSLSRASSTSAHRVVLEPGAAASFGFDRPALSRQGKCDPINGFRVFDPDGSGYEVTNSTFSDCVGFPVPIVVGPFSSGSDATIAP